MEYVGCMFDTYCAHIKHTSGAFWVCRLFGRLVTSLIFFSFGFLIWIGIFHLYFDLLFILYFDQVNQYLKHPSLFFGKNILEEEKNALVFPWLS